MRGMSLGSDNQSNNLIRVRGKDHTQARQLIVTSDEMAGQIRSKSSITAHQVSSKYSNLYGNNPQGPTECGGVPSKTIEEEEEEYSIPKLVKRKMRDTREPIREEQFTFDQLKDLLKCVLHSSVRKLKRKPKPQHHKPIVDQDALAIAAA